jgi:hypothetical protein
MTDAHAHDPTVEPEPEPSELELTDNSTGTTVDDHRVEDVEEETRQQAD